MAVYKCKMCGGALEIGKGQTIIECEYCGTQQTLPRLDDDRRANLYDRAGHFRRSNEYDKAANLYESILNEDKTDAEAYWSLVLCRYGIEYVEDPQTHKRVPTVNRAQFTSIFDDDNYRSALEYADGAQRSVYQAEAAAINEIQKGILAISQQEQPFDVFICYKETDENGKRTQDSVLANDLYHQLTREGFKVFFARITLEDKLGSAYEPYIFAALNSAKVMVAIGTKPSYFNAVWVKNEWSRYLALVRQSGGQKALIPAYKDMDPYDLPEEFSHLQAQDMSKLGFMQDLIRGIAKLTGRDRAQSAPTAAGSAAGGEAAPLLKRAFLYLEDGEWASADEYCEKALDRDPENAQAYLGKLMVELKCNQRKRLYFQQEPFSGMSNYQKAMRFADASLKEELEGYNKTIVERNKRNEYNQAVRQRNSARTERDFANAAELFKKLAGYQDADKLYNECMESAGSARQASIYDRAEGLFNSANTAEEFTRAETEFLRVHEYKDAGSRAEEARKSAVYARAMALYCSEETQEVEQSQAVFMSIAGFKDAEQKAADCPKRVQALLDAAEERRKTEIYEKAQAALDKNIIAMVEQAQELFASIPGFRDADEKAASCPAVIAQLQREEEALQQAKQAQMRKIRKFAIIGAAAAAVAFAALLFVKNFLIPNGAYKAALALKEEKQYTQAIEAFAALNGFRDSEEQIEEIKRMSTSDRYAEAMALEKEGKYAEAVAIFIELGDYSNCPAHRETCLAAIRETMAGNQTRIAAGNGFAIGLRGDGVVLAVGDSTSGQCNVNGWTDMAAVAAGDGHTVGLKSDGTVVATGNNDRGQCNVLDWTDITAIAAGDGHTVGLKSDGTVVAVGKMTEYDKGQCDVSSWTSIVAVAAGNDFTIGLKQDGTVVVAGSLPEKDDLAAWQDIVAISAGGYNAVGLKANGTVVGVDSVTNRFAAWTDIVAVAVSDWNVYGLRANGTAVMASETEVSQGQEGALTDMDTQKKIVAISAGSGDTVIAITEDGAAMYASRNEKAGTPAIGWEDLTAVAAGESHSVALKKDGTVLVAGRNDENQGAVSDWKDITAIDAGAKHTVGLKADGTVVAAGEDKSGQCKVNGWTDIAAVDAGSFFTVGLTKEGKVLLVGSMFNSKELSAWTDITAISAGMNHTVGLKANGTVVAVGYDDCGQCAVSGWKGITAISAGANHTVGLKANGTVVAVGKKEKDDAGQCDVSAWTDIVAIAAGEDFTVGLKADGTVVAVGSNAFGQCDVSAWTDIVAIAAGKYFTIGLRADGTAVAVGANNNGQSNVSNWVNMLPGMAPAATPEAGEAAQ